MKLLPHTAATNTAKRWMRSSMILVVLGMLVSGCETMPELISPQTDQCQLSPVPELPPREPDGTVVLQPEHQTDLLILFYEVEQCRADQQ